MTDFLDEKRKEITARLKELKPLVEEYQRLEAAASALDGVGGSTATAAASTPAAAPAARKAPGRRGPGRPKGSKTRTAKAAPAPAATTATATAAAPAKRGGARRKAGRRKGSGTRAAQALSFVQAQPGITIPELAARMGIKQNYLYRVLPSLEEEGKVAKQGRGWHPKGS
ncbi:MAG TPA: winged helix-turn-helix domain-containing protein [Solirubrobacteraceae bacterium]